LQKNVAILMVFASIYPAMESKKLKDLLAKSKAGYFENANAVLDKHKLSDTSVDSFRQFMSKAKKAGKSTPKKAAS
jgi:hypothetical protein